MPRLYNEPPLGGLTQDQKVPPFKGVTETEVLR